MKTPVSLSARIAMTIILGASLMEQQAVAADIQEHEMTSISEQVYHQLEETRIYFEQMHTSNGNPLRAGHDAFTVYPCRCLDCAAERDMDAEQDVHEYEFLSREEAAAEAAELDIEQAYDDMLVNHFLYLEHMESMEAEVSFYDYCDMLELDYNSYTVSHQLERIRIKNMLRAFDAELTLVDDAADHDDIDHTKLVRG